MDSVMSNPRISPIHGCGHGYPGKSIVAPVPLRTLHVTQPAGALRATRFAPDESVDVLSGTPAHPNCRAPCLCQHLHDLASRIGELCGLIRLHYSDTMDNVKQVYPPKTRPMLLRYWKHDGRTASDRPPGHLMARLAQTRWDRA